MRPVRRRPRGPSLWLSRAVAALCCALPLAGGSRIASASSSGGQRPAGRATGARAGELPGQATAGPAGVAKSPSGSALLANQRTDPEHGEHESHEGGPHAHGELDSHGDGQDEYHSSGELDSGADPDEHGEHDSHEMHGHAADTHHDDEPHSGAKSDDHGGHDSHDMHDHGAHDHMHSNAAAAHHGGHGEHGHKPNGRGASSVAVGLVTTAVMIPLVVWMALSEGLLGTLTMKMLDTFVSIFLAVLWFSAFNQLIVTFKVGTWFPYAGQVVCFVQVMVLYFVAMTVAWLWRDKQMKLTTFTVCGAHYIAFAGIGATAKLQEELSASVGEEWSIWSSVTSFAFVIMAIGFLMTMYVLNWMFFRVGKTDEAFQRSIDEMEIDIAGLVASFLATQAVRQAITGKFPEEHLFLQSTAWQMSPSNALQRNVMLAWSMMLTIMASIGLPMLEEWTVKKGDRWTHLGFRFLKVVLIMMVAWGYLVWGTWQFYSLFHGDQMYGNMLFASLCTFVVLAVLYLLSMLQESDKVTSETARETNNITVSGLSLVAAWSWEHCFTLAFDVIGHRYDVGFEGLVPKLFMAIAIPCILIPTYVKHVRTYVLAAEENEEEEQEWRKRQILERAGLAPTDSPGTSPQRDLSPERPAAAASPGAASSPMP